MKNNKKRFYSGIECTLSKFADDMKISVAVDTREGKDAIQRDMDKLENWAHEHLMKFNKFKCKVLYLDWGNSRHEYRQGEEVLENRHEEKVLGDLMDKNLDMIQQCVLTAQRAKCILSCTKSSREVILSLYSAPGVLLPSLGSST
ncbi:rna-directed dna polymerase from mobile element jockey-like [Willisornis vidua]|uniref:Rna-directed dna polymerase from mobile element jockey-like n=1 Tax=Willisornis vidua TaxID=1566151 RepID=A0ABQ9D0D5_9PASS|nr:rna-directed dna polymerase from mobile element jockey-like [Willisornis vidua]